MYNPYLENVTKKHSKHSSTAFKVYDIDGNAPSIPGSQGQNRAVFPGTARRRETGHNDRFYDEQEYERRVRKRRARLLVVTEEAFTHIKRMHDEQGKSVAIVCVCLSLPFFHSLERWSRFERFKHLSRTYLSRMGSSYSLNFLNLIFTIKKEKRKKNIVNSTLELEQ